ncbi:toxin-antitoxin system YwqK family antitoxin [Tenacibaculum amylolyticum]|uniref:toxin-antitoxin system YwqK family antitoxin n=1 Tax=Tenacibaculum amylolyticum TaxID=104269 RepID=UPI003896025C
MKNNYTYLLFIVCLIACVKEKRASNQVLDYNDKDFQLQKGVLLYNDKPFTGTLLSFDAINDTYNRLEYFGGKKDGEELKKYKNGVIAEQRFYKQGNKVGKHSAWWKNGTIKFEYHFNQKGEYNGTVKEWYRNGQPLKIFNFKNGREEGSQKMWQSDGKIRANFVTKKGERFGLIGLKKCYSVNTKNEDFN